MRILTLLSFVMITVFLLIINASCNVIYQEEIIRIHIRASSNREEDQNVKYLIKDQIIAYITPLAKGVKDKNEMYKLLNNNLDQFQNIADKTLYDNGFEYKSKVSLKKEEFPLRTYDGITFPEGVYDSLIIKLGEGHGDNWWCVAFPPLCFIGAEENGEDYFTYKSKIMELLNER